MLLASLNILKSLEHENSSPHARPKSPPEKLAVFTTTTSTARPYSTVCSTCGHSGYHCTECPQGTMSLMNLQQTHMLPSSPATWLHTIHRTLCSTILCIGVQYFSCAHPLIAHLHAAHIIVQDKLADILSAVPKEPSTSTSTSQTQTHSGTFLTEAVAAAQS
jgi:hypothetical protein